MSDIETKRISKEIEFKGEFKSESKNGWQCKTCTYINSLTITNCEICSTRRPYKWKCEICKGFNNHDDSKCQFCRMDNSIISSEKYMERPKVMRNPDNSWNCPRCTICNLPNVDICHMCLSRNHHDMILDELHSTEIQIRSDSVDPVTKDEESCWSCMIFNSSKYDECHSCKMKNKLEDKKSAISEMKTDVYDEMNLDVYGNMDTHLKTPEILPSTYQEPLFNTGCTPESNSNSRYATLLATSLKTCIIILVEDCICISFEESLSKNKSDIFLDHDSKSRMERAVDFIIHHWNTSIFDKFTIAYIQNQLINRINILSLMESKGIGSFCKTYIELPNSFNTWNIEDLFNHVKQKV